MTDGILLAEIQRDRMLRRYDTLIIDEAHERSLNIDFLLGYLKQLLPRRPDLKVIITSATIDPERFAAHFGDAPDRRGVRPHLPGRGPLPAGHRPGRPDDDRTATRSRPSATRSTSCPPRARATSWCSCPASGRSATPPTRWPSATCATPRSCRCTPGCPPPSSTGSSSRTPAAAIVLATNVAETSLTVPGIRYVIDPGTARISRYSHRTKVQRLPIEPISQASANQRKGRCGRVADGICIRLYSEEDFVGRPEFTDPEILRTNLASVILQMTALGLGDIAAFPFVDPPDRRNITDGVHLLHELGALRRARRLTGRSAGKLAQLPVDPRLARMVARGRPERLRRARSWSSPPPVHPGPPRAPGRQRSRRPTSSTPGSPTRTRDFLSYLNLWNYLREQQKELSCNQFRKLCRAEFLNYLRVREWQDLHGQLRQVAKRPRHHRSNDDDRPNRSGVHLSLLAGLLSHIGLKDVSRRRPRKRAGEYLGARRRAVRDLPRLGAGQEAAALGDGRRAGRDVPAVGAGSWPGSSRSGSSRSPRTWSSAPTASRTGRSQAGRGDGLREGDAVRPADRGRAARSTTAASTRSVRRELFIRHALVEGDWQTHHQFFHRQPRAARRGRRAGAPGPAPRHPGRRRGAVRLLRRARSAPTWSRRGTSTAGGRRPAGAARTCSRFDPVDADQRRRRGRQRRRDYPDHVALRTALQLPLTYQFEPGTRDRRRHRRRPAAGARTRSTPTTSAGRCPACARSWSPR